MSLPLKIDAAVICEDVRMEANGKYMLLGVYTGNIIVAALPARLQLRCYIHGMAHAMGEAPLDLFWKAGDDVIAEFRGSLSVFDGLEVAFVTPPVVLEIPPGANLELRVGSPDGEIAVTKVVQVGAVSPVV